MPFYGKTHQVFLLLSRLSTRLRNKLYCKFVNQIAGHCLDIEIRLENMSSHLFLPLDLFVLNIYEIYDWRIDCLIRIIQNISLAKGWYFNKHCNQQKLNIQIELFVFFTPNLCRFKSYFLFASKSGWMFIIKIIYKSKEIYLVFFLKNMKNLSVNFRIDYGNKISI